MKNDVFWDVLTRATRRNIPEDTIPLFWDVIISKKKSKAIPVTGHGGL
jgi:hypothetical protein